MDELLWRLVKIYDKQYDYIKGRCTVDAILIVIHLWEKRLEGNGKLHFVFIHLQKAYCTVPRVLVYWCLRKRKVPVKIVRLVEMKYDGASTALTTTYGNTEMFEVYVGLNQGFELSPFLFVLVMDVLSEKIINQQQYWELLCAV